MSEASRLGRHGTAGRVSLAGLALALAATACGGSTGSSAGSGGSSSASSKSGGSAAGSTANYSKYLIDFANGSEQGVVYQGLQSTLKSTLAKVGAQFHAFNNNYDESTTFQNLSVMINQHPNVIVEYNPVAGASSRLGDQLKRSGIPCIAPNVPVPGCYFFNEDLGLMGKQLAQTVASMMKQKGWSGTNTDVVLVEIGSLGSLNDGLYDFYGPLTNMVSGMKKVSASSMTTTQSKIGSDGIQINPDYSIDAGYKSFASLLQGIPAGKHLVVDCLGDDTCLGAYRALQQTNRTSDAMLMGWGTEPQAMKLLRSGPTWVAESANFFSYWGEFIAPEALAVASGVKPPPQTYPPMAIVTKSNADQYFNPDGSVKQFPALVPQDNYLLKTGVLQKMGNVAGVS